MYVNERSGFDPLTDPYQGEFGGFGAGLSGGNPFETAQTAGLVSKDQLLASLTECAGRVVTTAIGSGRSAALDEAARCAWDQLWVIVSALPEAEREALLISITTDEAGNERSCSSALTSILGLPGEASAILCALGGDFWSRIRLRAGNELLAVWKARGGQRADADGGGWRVVDQTGTLIAVECDGDLVDPSVRCPWTVAGGGVEGGREPSRPRVRTAIARRSVAALRPVLTAKPLDQYKSGGEKPPWYKNKWVWIGGAVVLVGGTTAVVLARRRIG